MVRVVAVGIADLKMLVPKEATFDEPAIVVVGDVRQRAAVSVVYSCLTVVSLHLQLHNTAAATPLVAVASFSFLKRTAAAIARAEWEAFWPALETFSSISCACSRTA